MCLCVCAAGVGREGEEQQLTVQECISAQKVLRTIMSMLVLFWDPLKIPRENKNSFTQVTL